MQDFSMGGVYSPTKSLLSSLLLGLLSLYSVADLTAGAESWRCPSGLPNTQTVETYNGHCYQFVDTEKYWTSARDYCWQYGGKLVKIGDKETNHFIVTTLNNLPWRNKGVWIGLHDNTREMKFEWVTESAYTHEQLGWSHWGRGHPGAFFHAFRDCVRMVRGSGHWRWHETPCTVLKWKYKFICEYGMTPTTTTTTTAAPQSLGGVWWQRGSSKPESGDARRLSTTTRRLSTTTRRLSVTTWRLSSTTKLASKLLVMTSPNTRQTNHVIGPLGAQAAQRKSAEGSSGSTALIGGMLSCLIVIVLVSVLFFLLFRRRKQHYVEVEEPTDTSIVPIYVDDLSDIKKQMNITVNELSERPQNDYVDHPRQLPAVPLTDAARRSACYIEPDNVSDDENVKYDNMAPRSPDYLPMDGQKGGEEATKDDAPKKVTYDVPKPMNIYSEIPERPEIYENMYESLDDVKRKKKEGGDVDK